MPETSYAVAIGSNRRHGRHGAPGRVVAAAFAALGAIGRLDARSPVIRTAAMGPAGRAFANAAALLTTTLGPPALLDALKQIEREFGRRNGQRWGSRVLDLDIVLWSEGAWAGPRLCVPHPDFRSRDFVLAPLTAIAPDWRDPLTGRTIRQLHALVDRRPPKRLGQRAPRQCSGP